MEPKIINRPAFTVIGMKYRGKNENQEIPQLWRQFGPRAMEIKNIAHPGISYGVMDYYDESTGEFDYIASLEVESVEEIPEGMDRWDVPEQTYACFTCTLPTLIETFKSAYNEWLPQSEYEHAPSPEFELYDEDFDPNVASSPMYIYIPIKKK
jgi:AraC family transcriptional regulator